MKPHGKEDGVVSKEPTSVRERPASKEADEKSPDSPEITPVASRPPRYPDGSYAVYIAVNSDEMTRKSHNLVPGGLSGAPSAVADAERLRRALEGHNFETLGTLYGSHCTLAALERGLAHVSASLRQKPRARLVVYLGGGTVDAAEAEGDAEGYIDPSTDRYHFVPHDGEASDPHGTCFPLASLTRLLARLPGPRHQLHVLGSPHAAPFLRRSGTQAEAEAEAAASAIDLLKGGSGVGTIGQGGSDAPCVLGLAAWTPPDAADGELTDEGAAPGPFVDALGRWLEQSFASWGNVSDDLKQSNIRTVDEMVGFALGKVGGSPDGIEAAEHRHAAGGTARLVGVHSGEVCSRSPFVFLR
jgi:hypothetical protein